MGNKRRLLGIIISLGSLFFLIWFLWPRSFDQAMGTLSQDDLVRVDALLISPFGKKENRSISFDLDSVKYQKLLSLLRSTRYQKILLPGNYREITMDYHVYLSFSTDDTLFSLHFCGDSLMDFTRNGSTQYYSPHGGDEFEQILLDFLLEQNWEAA